MTKTEEREAAKQHALKVLREMLSEGDEVGTVVTHGRGSTDWVECFVPVGNRIERISYYVKVVCDYTMTDKGIIRRGYNYDKSTDVVDSLSRALFGEGGKLFRNRLMG